MRPRWLFVLGLSVLTYAGFVVWYARGTTDIGLSCTFGTMVQRINADNTPADAAPEAIPQEGDQVLQIGPQPVETWSALLHVLADLDDPARFPRRVVPPTTPLTELERLPDFDGRVISRDGQDLVRVEIEREEAGRPIRVGCWRVVTPPPWAETAHALLWLAIKVCLLGVIAVVLWKRPEDEALVRFYLLCLVTVGAFLSGFLWRRILTSPPLLTVFITCAVLVPAVSLHFYLTFPRAKEFLRRWPRRTLGLLYGGTGVVLAVLLGAYWTVAWAYRTGHSPEEVRYFSQGVVHAIHLALAVAAVQFLGCVVSLGHSLAASPPGSAERNQTKWILTGALLATVPIAYVLYLAVTATERLGLGDAAWPMFFASLCFTVAHGISISRYGLMEVAPVLNWGLVSLGVSAAAGLVYSGLMFVGALVIGSRLEPRSPGWQAVWVGLTAWLLLLGLDLVRWRLRQAMGRLLHREKYQLDRTLRRVSEVVGRQVDPPALCRQFMQALGDLVAIPQGGIYLRSGDPARYRLTASLGAPPPLEELPAGAPLLEALAAAPLVQLDLGPGRGGTPAQRQLAELQGAVAVALRHEGALLAVLVIGPRRLGAYEAEALHLLTTLAPITALALHGAAGHQTIDTLNRDLQTKVEKISELQRRITTLQGQLLRARVADGEAPPAAGAAAVPAGVVGSGPAVQRLLDTVRKVAGSSSAVLIRGESGTGKELLARALHAQSPRAAGPLVTVHCAALSPTLLESELFGHVKGAFTGAAKDKPGRFELAHGGTLFLDEIGDISPDVQTKLLRVLQERTFERVGSNEPIRVDVRLIAATHQDLERLIREGKFREDLFYRLNVITIRTPPLRERREDLYELALHFLRQHSQRCHKELTGIDDEALEALKAHDWPGNVRELENAIERAVVLSDGPSLTLRDLPEEVQRGPQARTPVPRSVPVPQPAWEADLDRREYDRLMQALAAANGNKARAARALGLPRTTFLSKLEKYGVGPRRG